MSRRSMLLNSFPAIESAQMLQQSAIDLHSKVYEDGKSGAVPSLPKFVTVSWPRKPKRLSVDDMSSLLSVGVCMDIQLMSSLHPFDVFCCLEFGLRLQLSALR